MPKNSKVLPRLTVTSEDAVELRTTAALLEAEVLGQYEAYVVLQRRHMDRSKWTRLRAEGDLIAYQEARSAVDELGFMSSSPTRASPLEPQASLADQSTVGRVLVTGTMPGTLEDALYGASFNDTESLRTQQAYQRDAIADSTVLSTLDGPSMQDPFRFLGITWHLRTSVLQKPRDCLLLQHTHLTTLPTGERIGVSLCHSIQHRDLPELPGFATARMLVSSVLLFRQLSVGTVEVFGIGLLDDKRRTPDAVQRLESARTLLATTGICDGGQKKKLHWLMRQRHTRQRRSPSVSLDDDPRECALCTKSTKRLFVFSGVCCQLCTQHVCSRCAMTMEIVIDAATANVVAKPFAFCIECILHTKKLSALELAQDDVRRYVENEKRRDGSPAPASRIAIR